jgi:hypothetical protein
MNLTWPIIPDHITLDGPDHNDSSKKALNGIGIIKNDFLRGLLTQIASSLRNPATILEFPPNNSTPVKTDSISIHFDLHPPCRKFRDATDTRYCNHCDILHANLFKHLDEAGLAEAVEERIHSSDYQRAFENEYRRPSDIHVQRFANHCLLSYTCPILGYRELLFPVIFEKKVISVMFVGQLLVQDYLTQGREHRTIFFQNHHDCFDEYNSQNPDKVGPELIELIDQEWRKDPKNIMSSEVFNEFIAQVFDELDTLQATLTTEMMSIRENFLKSQVNKYIQEIRENTKNMTLTGEQVLTRFWKRIEPTLEQMRKDFPAQHITIFAKNSFSQEAPTELELVSGSGLSRNSYNRFTFNISKLTEQQRRDSCTSQQYPDLLDRLDGKIKRDPKNDLIRIFPTPLIGHLIFVIWVRYNKKWPRLTRPDPADMLFNETIPTFYSFLSLIYSSIWAHLAMESLSNAFRILGHEIGQITFGMDALRNQIFQSYSGLREVSEDKFNLQNEDLSGYLAQLHFLTDGARRIVSDFPTPQCEYFWAFKEILYRWQYTYRLETLKRKIQIKVESIIKADPYRPQVYGDKLLLEELLYNLVNNAIKYCYPGTNIYIDCKKEESSIFSPHIIYVTDYGIEFDPNARHYERYRRGVNVKGIEGFGIGLYLANKIAHAHGGKIRVLCTLVSKYNIPMLEIALKRCAKKEFELPPADLQSMERELARLRQSGELEKITATNIDGNAIYYPTRNEILQFYAKPTFEVKIKVFIPSKESQQ